MYLLAASPLSKIFLTEWEDRILENPNIITDETVPFSFNVPFPTGAVGMFEYNTIIRLDDLPCVKRRIPEDRLGLYRFLTGGDSGLEYKETQLWGIVAAEFEMDMTRYTVDQMALEAEAIRQKDDKKLSQIEKKQAEMKKKFRQQYSDIQVRAKKIADEKVMDFIKFTVENLKDQWEKMKQDGKTPYSASVSELGCLFALKDYLNERNKLRSTLNKRASEFMDQINSF